MEITIVENPWLHIYLDKLDDDIYINVETGNGTGYSMTVTELQRYIDRLKGEQL